METILRAENISRSFKINDSTTVDALKDINLEVEKNKLVVLRGRSGSGKTTLINILGALDRPTGGDVYFDGKKITGLTDKEMDKLRRNDMSFVFQSVALIPTMTAYENVEFAMRLVGMPYAERVKRAKECLVRVGLEKRMHHRPGELSGGEQQRVAIARAISHKPKLIFADEPTAALDMPTGLAVMNLFKELVHTDGLTIVMTTHDTAMMEQCDVVYTLDDGRITDVRKQVRMMLAPPENVMVQCENLVKIYKTTDVEVMALQGLDLTVERGELMGIVGASGSGKSTLLNMLGALDKPSAGSLYVDGKDLLKFDEKDLIKYKRETVGFVWQNNARNLIPYLTAIQNVEMPLLLSGHKNRRERAEELLDMVGLSARKNSLLGQLSGGEQQRVAIAIALSNNPSLLLADEPTGAVDTKTAAMVLDVFKQLNRQMGVTIIIVTHDTNLSKSIDRVVAIRDGRTSSEMLRKKTEILSFGELEKMSEQQRAEHEKLMQQSGSDHEELVVLDRAGRLQIPKEYLEALGIRGGDKVRVELEDGKISVYNSDYNMHG